MGTQVTAKTTKVEKGPPKIKLFNPATTRHELIAIRRIAREKLAKAEAVRDETDNPTVAKMTIQESNLKVRITREKLPKTEPGRDKTVNLTVAKMPIQENDTSNLAKGYTDKVRITEEKLAKTEPVREKKETLTVAKMPIRVNDSSNLAKGYKVGITRDKLAKAEPVRDKTVNLTVTKMTIQGNDSSKLAKGDTGKLSVKSGESEGKINIPTISIGAISSADPAMTQALYLLKHFEAKPSGKSAFKDSMDLNLDAAKALDTLPSTLPNQGIRAQLMYKALFALTHLALQQKDQVTEEVNQLRNQVQVFEKEREIIRQIASSQRAPAVDVAKDSA